jgi:hypothetical protein
MGAHSSKSAEEEQPSRHDGTAARRVGVVVMECRLLEQQLKDRFGKIEQAHGLGAYVRALAPGTLSPELTKRFLTLATIRNRVVHDPATSLAADDVRKFRHAAQVCRRDVATSPIVTGGTPRGVRRRSKL